MVGPDVIHVRSYDGTSIACWRVGVGSPLVMIHGTTGDHDSFRLVAPLLADRFTVYSVDRRGRGESGDTEPYAFEREVEDAAAIVDALDEPADLFGHSFGANLVLEAAPAVSNLRRLVAYEPSVGGQVTDLSRVREMEALLERGDREGALEVVLRQVVALSPEEFERLRASPMWNSRVAAVHTVPRELQADLAFAFDASRFANVRAPTLFLLGGDSPARARAGTQAYAAALPDARIVMLEGQGHAANVTAPELVAREIAQFLSG